MKFGRHLKLRLMNFYPPFIGAGIRIDYMASDFREVHVSMKLRFWNKNYVNTHYGGSLYSMCDPFFMRMIMQILGRDYIVWDKAANIRFKKPGKGKVRAIFRITDEDIAKIHQGLKDNDKYEPTFVVDVVNTENEIVCSVEKLLYIKKKEASKGLS